MRGVDASKEALQPQSVATCRTMQSVRPLLLLLLLVPALAVGRSKGPRSILDNLLQNPISDFINKYSIANVSANTYQAMEQAKRCTPIPEFVVKFLLTRVKLVFFYGPSIVDRYEVSLDDAPKLVNHLRWKKDLPMAVYSFGWLNTPYNVYSHQIAKAYHRNGGFNLVLVAWHESGTWLEYGAAVTMVPRVGRAVAQALSRLPSSVTIGHLVGHSLGAQVTGHIARTLRSLRGRPRFIIGLDPAGPLFYPTMFGCQDPISSKDADYVTAVHTDWSRLGANEMTGPVDFMPHDGHRLQPGCTKLDIDTSPALDYSLACSHNRAVMLFANAISNSSSIVGTQCYSNDAFMNKLCQNNPKAYLTEPSENTGVFYFTTKDSEPYGRGVEGA